MKKLFILSVFIFLSCNDIQKKENAVIQKNNEVVTQDWPKKTFINGQATSILSSWVEYNAFDSSIETLYDVTTIEDLFLVVEDLIEKQKLLENAPYPTEYDIPQIKSRQRIVLTYLLKLKANLEYKLDTKETVKQLIVANNAMRQQFNVIVNNPLDSELIQQEEQLKQLEEF